MKGEGGFKKDLLFVRWSQRTGNWGGGNERAHFLCLVACPAVENRADTIALNRPKPSQALSLWGCRLRLQESVQDSRVSHARASMTSLYKLKIKCKDTRLPEGRADSSLCMTRA